MPVSENPFYITPEQKVNHLSTQFGPNARITKIFQRLSILAGENPTLEQLETALSVVENELKNPNFQIIKPRS